MATKVIEISISEYNVKRKPNYLRIGKKVDKILQKNFPNGRYILRAVGSSEHPKLSVHQVSNLILKHGTDKYDSKKKSFCHEEFSGYDYDFQAGRFEIKNSKLIVNKEDKIPSTFGDIVYHFYEHAPLDRGYPVKIDLLLIYDTSQLKKARKFNSKSKILRKGLNKYLYKFKNRKNKQKSLLGIVKIV